MEILAIPAAIVLVYPIGTVVAGGVEGLAGRIDDRPKREGSDAPWIIGVLVFWLVAGWIAYMVTA